jgi:hypothetical protein
MVMADLGPGDPAAGGDGLDGHLLVRVRDQVIGVVRILKDLDTDICGRHVLVVEDIIDSGLTLSWLMGNLRSREPASLRVCVLLRKPGADQMGVEVAYTGFDIGDEFVVGTGSTTPSATGICRSLGPSRRTSTVGSRPIGHEGNTISDRERLCLERARQGPCVSRTHRGPGAVYRQVSLHHSRE